MRGDILQSNVVDPESYCACCNAQATIIVQGETDSIGYEPLPYCKSCYDQSEAERQAQLNALDIEDKAPPEGMVFWFAGCSNHDRHYWAEQFISYREAVKFYRACERLAEPLGGIYPFGSKVTTKPAEEAAKILAAAAKEARLQAEWEAEQEKEYRDYEERRRLQDEEDRRYGW